MSFFDIFLEGSALGLGLSFLVGPLLFSIVQAGLERGFRAGAAVGAGIWASDLFFVAAVVFGLKWLEKLSKLPDFERFSGIAGALLLIVFGAATFFSKPKTADFLAEKGRSPRSIRSYFVRGFLINSVNPFTVFFWLGVSATVLVPRSFSRSESLVFFGGMLAALVLTDLAKAFFAQKLARWLTAQHIAWVKKGLGAALVAFGIALFFRAF